MSFDYLTEEQIADYKESFAVFGELKLFSLLLICMLIRLNHSVFQTRMEMELFQRLSSKHL